MDITESVKRVYRSRLRADQAAATRLAIIRAASDLFAARGYVTTSIDDIAAAARVSRATVFTSVGGKVALLKLAYDVALVGDDEPVPLPARPRSRQIQAEPDARRFLTQYAQLVADIDARVASIYEAVRGAASADLDIAAMWREIQAERRVGAGNVVRMTESKSPLRAGLSAEAAADVVWVLIDPAWYWQLVAERQWSLEQFAAWLGQTLIAQLLP
ncbi:MAG TPA: helix-turn-helix domain-containing protein [Chloroflexota bacterium]|jgi:AcrR family transcriptional regulator|nr:helix-turn-helix domain-containing protein [Chloroflexota bacterium]